MTRRDSPRALLAVALALTLVVAGCREPAVPADDLSSWQSRPQAPDPNLAEYAVQQDACRSGQAAGFAVQILLQDRRTTSTAAFLVSGPGFWGSCIVSVGGSAHGSGRSDPDGPVVSPIVVDERSAGSVGSGFATLLGGRAQPNVTKVLVDLPDGRTVEGSLGNGYWLAWWPVDAAPVRVRALDAAEDVLATLTESSPGWQPR